MRMQFDPAKWLRDFRSVHGDAALTAKGYLATTRCFSDMTGDQREKAFRLQQQLADPRKLKAVWDLLRSRAAPKVMD
jgi:hypothetical protein